MALKVEITVPVLNEERDLPPSTRTLHGFLTENLSEYDWRIIIADNGSTDGTPEIADSLSRELGNVGYLRLEQRGRGGALKESWLSGEADILAYMDVDLSTELEALPKLVQAIDNGGYALAIGSRLARGATVVGRPPHREVISRVYNGIIKVMFQNRFKDAQCGFKAISRAAARDLVPLVEDTGWFFDSELLILAEKNGYKIKEVPVRWKDDADSRVDIAKTAYGDLAGLVRLRTGGLKRASRALAAGTKPEEQSQ